MTFSGMISLGNGTVLNASQVGDVRTRYVAGEGWVVRCDLHGGRMELPSIVRLTTAFGWDEQAADEAVQAFRVAVVTARRTGNNVNVDSRLNMVTDGTSRETP